MKRAIYAMMVALVALVMPSCANEVGDVLDTIPADVETVAMVDAISAIDHFGIEITDDDVKLPEGLKALKPLIELVASNKVKHQVVTEINALKQAVDLTQIAVFSTVKGDAYVTMLVTDEKLLEAKLEKQFGEAKSKSGFACYDIGNSMIVAVKGAQAWLVEGGVAPLKQLLEKASENPISSNEKVCEYLAQEKDARGVCSTRQLNIDEFGKDGWVRWCADLKPMGAETIFSVMKGDGSLVKFGEYLGEVDNKTISYVPQNAVFALAVGVDSKMQWDKVEEFVTPFLGYGDKGLIDVFRSYIQSIDGGVLFTIAPKVALTKQNVHEPETWAVKFMAKMPQDKIDEAIAKVVTTIENDYPLTLPKEGDFYVIPYPEMPIKIGQIDGYFVVSSGDVASSVVNENMGKSLSGSHASAVLNIDDAASALKYVNGINAKIRVEDEEVRLDVKVELPNSLANLLF